MFLNIVILPLAKPGKSEKPHSNNTVIKCSVVDAMARKQLIEFQLACLRRFCSFDATIIRSYRAPFGTLRFVTEAQFACIIQLKKNCQFATENGRRQCKHWHITAQVTNYCFVMNKMNTVTTDTIVILCANQ